MTHDGDAAGFADATDSPSLAEEIERAHDVAERVAEEALRIGSSDPRADRAGLLRLIHLSSGVEHRLFGLAHRASLLDAERADEREAGMALSRHAAAIARITAALSESLTSDEVVVALATDALAALDAQSLAVFVPSDAGDAMEMIGSVNVPEALRAQFQRVPLDAALPLVSAWQERQPIFFDSLDATRPEYPLLYRAAADMRADATAAVPFDARTDRGGVLTITYDRPHAFDEVERRFVVTLGQLCGQAMHRARLYDSACAERRRAAAAERQAEAATRRLTRLQRVTSALCGTLTDVEVAEVVLAEALAASGAFGGGVVVLSDDGRELITLRQTGIQSHLAGRFARFPISTPCMARDVLTAGPLFMSFGEYLAHYPMMDVWRIPPWMGARAAVPFRTPRGPIGALTLMFADAREFSEEDRAFLTALGDQCAIALERARLLRKTG